MCRVQISETWFFLCACVMIITKRDRKRTAPEIREEFNHSRPDDSVSVTTIKDRLTTYGLCGRIAASKQASFASGK